MKLIAVISHKGGAGKTTSSVQIAEELARRGQRTLLVDADRQQGAGLLLGIDAPAGCVQRTSVPELDYLGSARLTDLEIADCYASFASRFDVGVVDTPSLDDPLARAWLREASAALMVLQVDPLTVKTLPSALNTLEVVRAFKPTIQILGLLPTMFDQSEEAHGRLLAELLSRRPDAVFTPVVPADPGLMHRANAEECPEVGEAARQAYQCAVDRILRSLAVSTESVALPHAAGPRPSWSARAQARTDAGAPPPAPAAAPPAAPVAAAAPPRAWQEASVAPAGAPAVGAGPHPAFGAAPENFTPPSPGPAPVQSGGDPYGPPPAGYPAPPAETGEYARAAAAANADRALEELAAQAEPSSRRQRTRQNEMPAWWPGQQTRIDAGGVARRPESWWVRYRFSIACTVACLALIAAIFFGTVGRAPTVSPWGAAMAGPHPARHAAPGDDVDADAPSRSETKAHKKSSDKRSHGNGEGGRSGRHRGK